nr:hypothetical protein [Tanacetum cinerariifolium]
MEVRSEFSKFLENKESVEEVVVGGGEACGVGDDELNRVISALKNGGGEFDGRLDEINLNLSEELVDNGVSPIPTSLVVMKVCEFANYGKELLLVMLTGSWIMGETINLFNQMRGEEWCCVMSKVVEGKRRKKVLVMVAKGKRTTGGEDGIAVGLGYGIPESRYILDITLRTRWL